MSCTITCLGIQMTEQDIIDKLKLTPEQLSAFKRMQKALKEFEKAGGQLIGVNDYYYAVNGKKVIEVRDSYLNSANKSSILVEDTEAPNIHISNPFIDSSPFIVVKL